MEEFKKVTSNVNQELNRPELNKKQKRIKMIGSIMVVIGFVIGLGGIGSFAYFGFSALGTMNFPDTSVMVIAIFGSFIGFGMGSTGLMLIARSKQIQIMQTGARIVDTNSYCQNCGDVVLPGEMYCSKCGKPLLVKKVCSKCHFENEVNDSYCKKCGNRL